MRKFLSRISPTRAVSDFAEHWSQPTPHRWQILGVACAATFSIFMLFIPDSTPVRPARPELTYISTFADNRSDAEIIASNCANQELQDAIEARIAEREELRREMYRALGRATFVDVDDAVEEAEVIAEEEADAGPTEEDLALSVAEYCARAAEG